MSAKRKTMPLAMVCQGSPQQNRPLGSHITLHAPTHNLAPTQSLFGQPMVVATLEDMLTACMASVKNMVLS